MTLTANPARPSWASSRPHPAANTAATARFVVVTCGEYPRRDDKANGHRIYHSILTLKPHFLVHTGDVEYCPNRERDGPQKTISGDEQKAWFFRTVAQSDATFKVPLSATPCSVPIGRIKAPARQRRVSPRG